MPEATLMNLVLIPVGLGLLGFVEPCSFGSSLLFIKFLEGRAKLVKLAQVGVFMLTRGLFIGALGASVALVGASFLRLQKGAWLVLGSIYMLIGILYLVGRAGLLMRTIGPGLNRLSATQGSVGLGVLFGLNIPACAAPLVFALLGAAAISGGEATLLNGFVSLGLFGLALSVPLALVVLLPAGRRLLDWLAGLTLRIPIWIGVIFVVLGLWSMYFGLFVNLEDWA